MTTTFSRQAVTALALAFCAALLVPTGAAAVGVGKTCGGIAGVACDYGMFCDFKIGSCRISDAQGKCVKELCVRPDTEAALKDYYAHCDAKAATAITTTTVL